MGEIHKMVYGFILETLCDWTGRSVKMLNYSKRMRSFPPERLLEWRKKIVWRYCVFIQTVLSCYLL